MKNKKRKNKAMYLASIRQAIRDGQVWVRSTSDVWDEVISYDISFCEDFWCKGAIPVFVQCSEDGKIMDFSIGDRYNPQKMTKEANLELLQELDKVIIMYKIGAFQAVPEGRLIGRVDVGTLRFNTTVNQYEIWNGYTWLPHRKQDTKRQAIRKQQTADLPKGRKRKHKYYNR